MDKDWSSSIPKNDDCIREIIAHDDEDEFTSILEKSSLINSGNSVKLKFGESEFCPYKLLGWICEYRAIHCCTALVEGKTGVEVDLNLPIDGGGTPLHEAASSLSSGLVEVFLRHGAQADIRCSAFESEKHGLLPLQIALERVSSTENLNRWTPKQSVFKLIIILCLPKMKEALETNKLLAQDTKEVEEVIRHYAKEAKLVELAILMMVAQEKFKEPIRFQSKDDHNSEICTTFHQCVKIELGTLIDYEYGIMGKKEEKKLLKEIKERQAMLISTLRLLEIFERAGAAIQAYIQSQRTNAPKEQVVQELARLLAEAGFILKSRDTDLSDIVDSCPMKLVSRLSGDPDCGQDEKSEEPSEHVSQQKDVRMPPYSQPGSFSDGTQLHGVPNERLIGTVFPFGSSVSSGALHPFHASWIPKAGFCSGFPKSMNVQVEKRSAGIEHYVRNFPSSRRWFSFALAVKRAIRGL